MSRGSTEGDLTKTGMALKHDREWDYELDRIVEAIEERDASKVGLQFPEGLKRRGPKVADDLRAAAPDDVTFMISGQPCYGACDLDTYLMRRTDVFVHFGHTPMKESDSIIYVPLFSNVDPFPIMEESLAELEDPEENPDVGLVTTAQHMNRFEEMTDWLEKRGYEVHTRRGDDRLTKEGQVLGCNYASADIPADQVLYVGGGKFHPVGLAMEHPESASSSPTPSTMRSRSPNTTSSSNSATRPSTRRWARRSGASSSVRRSARGAGRPPRRSSRTARTPTSSPWTR